MNIPTTLLDITGLEYLEQVCRKFKVQFIAHGGLVRRYISRLHNQANSDLKRGETNLFDLTPFISDIDLVHSGTRQLTPKIYRYILEIIPFAECFHWELHSQEEIVPYKQAAQCSGIVPVNLMSLSTNANDGLMDPWHGRRDIEQHSYRYIRNGFYKKSPLFLKKRDLEFFSVLLYFQALLEADIQDEMFSNQPGWDDALSVIHDAICQETIIALQESAYLRARLHYLLKRISVASQFTNAFSDLLKMSGLRKLLNYIDIGPIWSFGLFQPFIEDLIISPSTNLVASGRIGGDFFRLPHNTSAWKAGNDALEEIKILFSQQPVVLSTGQEAPTRYLGESQKVLLVSPSITLMPGKSPSSQVTEKGDNIENPLINEFIHFAVQIDGSVAQVMGDLGDENLAAILTITAKSHEEKEYTEFFPLNSVCTLKPLSRPQSDKNNSLLTIRINCGALLERSHELFLCSYNAVKPVIHIIVIGWTDYRE
jgi:hypothetical protein